LRFEKTDDVVYTRSCRTHLKLLGENKAMRIEKTGILLLSMTVLVTAGFVSNQAFAGEVSSSGQEGIDCEAAGGNFDFNRVPRCIFPAVGGIAVVVPDSVLYGELAQQYSLWLIPTISAVGIGAYIIKRKF